MKYKFACLLRLHKAMIYSIQGLRAAWFNEAAFRQELSVGVVAVMIAFWLDIDAISRLLLITSVMLVLYSINLKLHVSASGSCH